MRFSRSFFRWFLFLSGIVGILLAAHWTDTALVSKTMGLYSSIFSGVFVGSVLPFESSNNEGTFPFFRKSQS
jgi:hypothetical protein